VHCQRRRAAIWRRSWRAWLSRRRAISFAPARSLSRPAWDWNRAVVAATGRRLELANGGRRSRPPPVAVLRGWFHVPRPPHIDVLLANPTWAGDICGGYLNSARKAAELPIVSQTNQSLAAGRDVVVFTSRASSLQATTQPLCLGIGAQEVGPRQRSPPARGSPAFPDRQWGITSSDPVTRAWAFSAGARTDSFRCSCANWTKQIPRPPVWSFRQSAGQAHGAAQKLSNSTELHMKSTNPSHLTLVPLLSLFPAHCPWPTARADRRA
jgi:hypothetical protein